MTRWYLLRVDDGPKPRINSQRAEVQENLPDRASLRNPKPQGQESQEICRDMSTTIMDHFINLLVDTFAQGEVNVNCPNSGINCFDNRLYRDRKSVTDTF